GRALGPPGRPKAGDRAAGTIRGLRPRGPAEGRPLRARTETITMHATLAAAPVAATWYKRKRVREAALVACFLLPSLAIFFLYRLLPLGWNVILSFESWSPLRAARWVGLDNY